MSYVRFSHDSDFYIYDTGEQFDVMISGARLDYKTGKYKDRHRPGSGEYLHAKDLNELVSLIRKIRRLGHRIPRWAFDAIKRDQRKFNGSV